MARCTLIGRHVPRVTRSRRAGTVWLGPLTWGVRLCTPIISHRILSASTDVLQMPLMWRGCGLLFLHLGESAAKLSPRTVSGRLFARLEGH
jgi:hypothetical protein